ncbi:MAG: hypothetical protein P8J52_08020 [Gammaproteobacteria bacterium]|nr:hypothetical protein [Gammaproteobacteria bacterium]MDG2117770.1 hypothetical protein [Gammaproteobacteria bacterium]
MNKKSDAILSLDESLIEEGTAQLNSEISVLESWLEELDAADNHDNDASAARKSYTDMLQSRREMLTTLNSQSKP